MNAMTIGQLAGAAEVNTDTVRYYERQGLLLPEDRTASGYRHYTKNSLQRLRFIKRAKTLGFSLKEIGNLLELSERETADCGDIRQCAREKLSELEPKIADMLKIKAALEKLAAFCPGQGKPLSECTILSYFYGDTNDED